jgi:hypothetical protein
LKNIVEKLTKSGFRVRSIALGRLVVHYEQTSSWPPYIYATPIMSQTRRNIYPCSSFPSGRCFISSSRTLMCCLRLT